MKKVVLASGNPGKLKEFQHLLSDCGLDVRPQSEFSIGNIEETGLTFVENAILKARHAAKKSGLPAISDDSGIEVDALMGAPGIYSARFSGEGATDKKNNIQLLKQLKDVTEEKRTARYQCVLVYMRHGEDPTPIICQASWEGRILCEERGENGFGYDPLFFVPTHGCTSAELEKSVKSTISHRAKAMQKLLVEIEGKELNE